ncbi:Type 1 glutamine amidotransferase-like domain-containing protein [Bifidobacterium sp.]|jgi:dipeptidase E|uniref:Type 1 glutamine amidotransferase-like domain-containing protein n=1 Tax=Bifidobacterium sp. TaxID=41200 RepID=UPI0025C1D63A|nr:Type 1 glutamine amidotransferase-like domain-containing protein [Bifidobacterium sp.]MCH4209703.1 Type 1 glutamine amidotransferase-like domain-containing protein [Bifidobacterium sp.]MCI1224527.1 Type 1 glutamine amidotransferase-like domain-containing protein [Bifidobacterium sp.]
MGGYVKNLFLASRFGGGIPDLLPDLFGSLAGQRAALIPTAGVVGPVKFPLNLSVGKLAKLGVTTKVLEVSTAPRGETVQAIRVADIIFVAGGNTFFLLQALRRSGADRLIAEHVAQGKLYIGVSAGAVVAGPDISYIRLMDDERKGDALHGDFSGLGLVDFSVVPHLRNVLFGRAAGRILARNDARLDLRALTNRQAVAVRGDSTTTVSSQSLLGVLKRR